MIEKNTELTGLWQVREELNVTTKKRQATKTKDKEQQESTKPKENNSNNHLEPKPQQRSQI